MSGFSTRRVAGFALLLVALVAAITVSYDSAFALCTHTTGHDAATRCAPPGVDLIALFFLPGLAFFVSDFSEWTFLGVGGKLQAARQEAEHYKEAAQGVLRIVVESGAREGQDADETAPLARLPAQPRARYGRQEGDVLIGWWRQIEPGFDLAEALRDPQWELPVRDALLRGQPLPSIVADMYPGLVVVPSPLTPDDLIAVLEWRDRWRGTIDALRATIAWDIPIPEADVLGLLQSARSAWSELPDPIRGLST